MRFLHTADWHLGRTLREYSLLSDQKARLQQLIDTARTEKLDAVIIAGDLYDRSVPPAQAVSMLDDILYTLTVTLGIPVLAIAGNHDSPQRVAFGSRLYAASGLYVEGEPAKEIRKVTLQDAHGPVDFWLLPYFAPEQVKPWFPEQEIRTYNDAFAALMQENLPRMDHSRRNVLIAHGYYRVVGEASMEEEIFSESEITIGGSDLIDLHAASDFEYIALGHLHAPQRSGWDKARYSGSLLKYSTSEARQKKGFLCVELDEQGVITQKLLSPAPARELRTVRGTLEQLLSANAPSDDFVEVTLTDEGAVLGAMERLRTVFPNALGLRFAAREKDIAPGEVSRMTQEELEAQVALSPAEMFSKFYSQVREEPLSAERMELVEKVIRTLEDGKEDTL